MDHPAQHEFLLPSGQSVVFDNPEGFYPVNPYQSQVLALASVHQALDLAAQISGGLTALKAAEWCCGNGPVAISLKKLGVGHVGAFDINAESVENTKHNAALNGVTLDEAGLCDITSVPASFGNYDLIAVNPPVRPNMILPTDVPAAVQAALSGGKGGTDLFRKALEEGRRHLTARGRLVIVLISRMDVIDCIQILNATFGARWYAAPATPTLHASPRIGNDVQVEERLLDEPEGETRRLIYREGDHLQVLSWMIVASAAPLPKPLSFAQRLPLHAYGQTFNPQNKQLLSAVQRLQRTFEHYGLN